MFSKQIDFFFFKCSEVNSSDAHSSFGISAVREETEAVGNSSVQLVTSSQPQRLATRCALLRKAERNHRGTIPGQAPCRTAWAQPKQRAQASSKGRLPASCKQRWGQRSSAGGSESQAGRKQTSEDFHRFSAPGTEHQLLQRVAQGERAFGGTPACMPAQKHSGPEK